MLPTGVAGALAGFAGIRGLHEVAADEDAVGREVRVHNRGDGLVLGRAAERSEKSVYLS